MSLSDKNIKEFQKISEKITNEKISKEEAYRRGSNLVDLVNCLIKIDQEQKKRDEKLKETPNGFHVEGNLYSCRICDRWISNDETWYDKLGIKCLICQKALNKKVIPKSVCKNRESWYSSYDLQNKFNIHPQTAKKLVREKKLKARIIRYEDGTPYFYIFLIKENKSLNNENRF